jgi:isoleucyl-tRNA synthetase
MAYNFKEIEENTRKIWESKSEEIEKATVEDDSSKKLFSFLEGPPTANAPPALHHLEVRTFKDIINKFKYMNGYSVPRKGGWDTHGLPVEVQVEKKLGLRSKTEVIEYGMDKFIEECKKSVFSNITDWEASTKELGYWIDLKKPYKPLDNNYIESVWWSLKELYDKKLLYEGFKVVPFCTRCGTTLSSHEVSQGYKDVTDNSVYIAFKLKNGEYILVWTTTPWTLPGNVALAVGPKIDYLKVELSDGDIIIVGKEKVDLIKGEYKIIQELKGSELVGEEYEPLFDIKELQNENSHKIILADFVTTEDGTGVVHTAGMYGEDDYTVCQTNKLPLIHTVGVDGKFNELVPQFQGKFVKAADKDIIEDLKKRHLLFKTEKISHTYPYCWRCDSPLLYYAIDSWFIAVTKVKDKMIKNNQKINWYPSHIKDGRFGKWLENIKDWNLSRTKFWGTPLPIWRCECGNEKIIGSVQELKDNSTTPFEEYDLHRPWIDKIKLKCECGKEMTRIPDLIDVWYDSGSASFAQFHYPFENNKEFEKRFPYDFISEAIDQTRGWFYTLHAISTMLFDKPAFKNVICAGLLVDENNEKMSKTKGNVIKPKEIIDKIGIDALRLQMCMNDPGNQKRFSENLVREVVLPFLNVLSNCKTFYEIADNDLKPEKGKIEDEWILSRLNTIIKESSLDLEGYMLDKAIEKIMNFVVNDLSRTYIKMTRDRNDTKEILGEVLKKVSLLVAPYAPYISEDVYSLFSEESVHLSSWPEPKKRLIDKKLEEEFKIVLEIIEKGLAVRDKEQIGLKWPLSKAVIKGAKPNDELQKILKIQLNVKKIVISREKENEIKVELDTKLTPTLESEGYARVISRMVQAERKKIGLIKTDEINLGLKIDKDLEKIIEKSKEIIKARTNSSTLEINGKSTYKHTAKQKIKGKEIKILVDKIE